MESLPPDVEPEESLGPLQPPFPSYTFRYALGPLFSSVADPDNFASDPDPVKKFRIRILILLESEVILKKSELFVVIFILFKVYTRILL